MLVEVAGLCDIFSRANLALPDASRLPRYSWQVASTTRRKTIEACSGLKVVADAQLAELDPTRRWGTVIVTGRGPESSTNEAVSDWLRLAARRAGRIVSVCAGAFLLAEAGLLDGKRATTHWQRTDELARRHPGVRVDPAPIYAQDGRIFTRGARRPASTLRSRSSERDLGSRSRRRWQKLWSFICVGPAGSRSSARRSRAKPGRTAPSASCKPGFGSI